MTASLTVYFNIVNKETRVTTSCYDGKEGKKETECYHSRLPFNLAHCSISDHHSMLPSLFLFAPFSADTELFREVDRPNIFIDPYFSCTRIHFLSVRRQIFLLCSSFSSHPVYRFFPSRRNHISSLPFINPLRLFLPILCSSF